MICLRVGLRNRRNISEPFETFTLSSFQQRPVLRHREEIICNRNILRIKRSPGGPHARADVNARAPRIHNRIKCNHHIARPEITLQRRIFYPGRNPNASLIYAINIVIDDLMILANHPNTARSSFVMRDEEIIFHHATIPMSQRQHSGAIPKRVVAVDVFARLVRNDFNLTVALLEKVVLYNRRRVAHRLPTVTDPHRLSTISPQWWTRSKMIVIDQVMV